MQQKIVGYTGDQSQESSSPSLVR